MQGKGHFDDRTKILIGEAGLSALRAARVAIYGLGGVGAACAMDLVRAGIGQLYVVDFDTVDISNLNRLYFGYRSTMGEPKTEAFSRFAKDINPSVSIETARIFFSGEEAKSIIDEASNIHADCVDSLNSKVNLISELCRKGKPFISSMGTAGRLAPERLRLGKIWETSGCPLAKSVRTRLRHLGVEDDFTVVWSNEPPVKPIPPASPGLGPEIASDAASPGGRLRMVQGSSPFVPQTAGHIMASWIFRRILDDTRGE